MATAHLIAAINIIAYGVIPFGLFWVIVHYRPMRWHLSGLFVHMVVVCVRAAMKTAYPESIFWNWDSLHTATATLSATCLIVGIVWGRRK